MKSRADVLRDNKHGRLPEIDGQHRTSDVSRRDFITASLSVTGGLLVTFHAVPATRAQPAPAEPLGFPSAYVRVDPDGRVTLWSAQPEMGEGTKTSLQMLIAEELDADWSRVVVEDASLDRRYGGQGVGGSDAIASAWDTLRRVGATARTLLVAAAAIEWHVPAAECETAPHVVRHRATRREAGFGALAARAASLTVPASGDAFKEASAYRLIGTRIGGVDNHRLVTGQPVFGIDVILPGMKYAAIAKCPVFGGRPVKVDASRARALPGVRAVVEIAGAENPTHLMPGVAVVADSTWAAFKGRDALDVEWAEGAGASESDATLASEFERLLASPPTTLHASGDVDAALAAAAHTVDATYTFPFVAHATLEPHNCTADYREGECHIRGPLQMPGSGRAIVARVLGIEPAKVHVHSTRIGGGFGRRLLSDYAAEAAVISRAAGVPVMVVDTRTGDLQHDYYRPAAMQRVRAGLDGRGHIVAWDHAVTSVSRNAFRKDPRPPHSTETYGLYIGGVQTTEHVNLDMQPTRMPNVRVRYGAAASNVPTGAWRAPSHLVNAFAIEATIDELAAIARRSPIDLRLALLGDPGDMPRVTDNPTPYDPGRMRRVILEAVTRGGFGARAPEGRARGFASHFTFGSYCAHVVEVSVDAAGRGTNAARRVVVHRVVSVADVGQVVNLSTLEAQMQGGVIDGLGAAFLGEVRIERGRATARNFGDYRLIRMREAPAAIESHFIESRLRPTGFGEPPLPPIAPAVANAIAALTGTRIRRMPFVRAGFVL